MERLSGRAVTETAVGPLLVVVASIVLDDDAGLTGAASASYTIGSVAGTNAGSYFVVVGNGTGTVQSATVLFTVNLSSTPGTGPGGRVRLDGDRSVVDGRQVELVAEIVAGGHSARAAAASPTEQVGGADGEAWRNHRAPPATIVSVR